MCDSCLISLSLTVKYYDRKADLTKSLGDAENTQAIDTTGVFAFEPHKFEIPAEIKQSAKGGVDVKIQPHKRQSIRIHKGDC